MSISNIFSVFVIQVVLFLASSGCRLTWYVHIMANIIGQAGNGSQQDARPPVKSKEMPDLDIQAKKNWNRRTASSLGDDCLQLAATKVRPVISIT
jgi:hypothetical protein